MGMCLEGVGKISVEVRRESFIIHPSYGYDENGDHTTDSFGISWRERPHPEFLLADLDDTIAALNEARAYLVAKGRVSSKKEAAHGLAV